TIDSLVNELGSHHLFDAAVVSGCEAMLKPDPASYRLVLERLGLRPEQALFIDDLRSNVKAAGDLGLHAVRFEGTLPLRWAMSGLGLPVPDRVVHAVPGVRAVLFDWGGVLERLPGEDLGEEIERRLSLQPGDLANALWGRAWRQLSVGAITDEQYTARVAEALGLPSPADADRIRDDLYGDDRLNREVLEAARSLRRDYRVGLVSNAWQGQYDYVSERFGLDVKAEFDVYVNSAWVGLRKPDPAIYWLALAELGVEPEEAILVDDLQRNLDSARQLGIHTVQFVDPDTSLAELESLLGHEIASDRGPAGRSE
ncbi:MAG: hypothetical protein E3J64_03520, partial [Anaerolineales bacterium]